MTPGTRTALFVPILLAVLVVGVVVVEAVQPSRQWVSQSSTDWESAHWEYRENPPPAGSNSLIMFGNSAAREAFDHRLYTSLTGQPSYNFGLTTSPVSTAQLASLPLKRGDTLLLILNGLALDGRVDTDPRLPWNQSDWLPGLIRDRQSIGGLIGDRCREALRRLAGRPPEPTLAGTERRVWRFDHQLDHAGMQEMADGIEAKYGKKNSEFEAGELLADATLLALQRSLGESVSYNEMQELLSRRLPKEIATEAIALMDLKLWCDEQGVTLRLAWLPSWHQTIERLFGLHRAAAQAVAAMNGLKLEQLVGLNYADYHDIGHLLESGREIVTRQLASQ